MSVGTKVGPNRPPGPFVAPVLRPNRNRPNTHRHEFGVQRSGLGPSVAKNSTISRSAQKLAQTGPRDPFFAPVLRPNRNHSKTHRHEFGVQRSGFGPSVVKNPIACRSAQKLARIGPRGPFVAPVLRPNRNRPNTHRHELGVQRSGLGPSVAKIQQQVGRRKSGPEKAPGPIFCAGAPT
jgi:hypothetical protein